MGIVYRAHDRHLDTAVVIKVPRRAMLEDPEFAGRFDKEIRSLVQLSHPNVVKILDVGTHGDLPFAVMQYLAGGSLEGRKRTLSSGDVVPMELEELSQWLEGVATALDFIHNRGFVHRDVKPANILFDQNGNVYLSDFGVAKAVAASREARQSVTATGTGLVLGTPDYMAPEQRRDAKNVDHRADIYSLGKVLYKLLTGERPSDIIPSFIPPPAALSEIIFKCVNPKVEERYFSVDDLVKDLEHVDFSGAQKRDLTQLVLQNICPHCNAPNAANDKFCAHCGDSLTSNCPECDHENSIQRPFCTDCGTDIQVTR
jgi:serine/threonine protein kinase